MDTIKNQQIVVVGGSRGLGLGVVESLVERGGRVAVIARDREQLAALEKRLGVEIMAADAAKQDVALAVLREKRPQVLVVMAGSEPPMAPVHEQTWEGFSANWNSDVKIAFHWVQQALLLPLAKGSRVLLASSGAAVAGSPMSGGYAGAKRMIWLLAQYANGISAELGRDIHFQALVPRQMVGGTGVGDAGAHYYASRKGVSPEEFLAGFGKPMPPRVFGDHVTTILADPAHEKVTALGIKGDTGIQSLDP